MIGKESETSKRLIEAMSAIGLAATDVRGNKGAARSITWCSVANLSLAIFALITAHVWLTPEMLIPA